VACACLISIVASLNAVAQVLPFHPFTTRDGLVSNYITDLSQDEEGRLWIATSDGISIFDGMECRALSRREGLPSNFVHCMARDFSTEGGMWIGTSRGLARYRRNLPRAVDSDPGLEGEWIVSLARSPDGSLWAGGGFGIALVKDGRLTRVESPAAVRPVTKIICTSRGVLWILNDRGVHEYDPSRRVFRTIDSTGGRYVSANLIRETGDGDVYVCARDSSILQFRDGKLFAKHRLRNRQPTDLLRDKGGWWITTREGLLYAEGKDLDVGRCVEYGPASGMTVTMLNLIFQDSEGILWFGSEGRGLVRLEHRNLIGMPESDMTGKGTADEAGRLWMTAREGLLEYFRDEKSRWTRRFHKRGRDWPEGYSYHIQAIGGSKLLVSFSSGVIAEFDIRLRAAPLRPSRIVAPGPGIPPPDPFCFLVDKKGRCWYRDRNKAVHVLQLSPKSALLRTFSSVHPDIRAMYEAPDGAVWVAGYNGGIFVNDAPDPLRGAFRRLEVPLEVSVRAFHRDGRGRMWIGTLEGLLLLRKNGFEKFGVEAGLPNERIGALAGSSTGGLWIGSQLGMAFASGDPVFISGHGEITDSPVGACGVLPDGVLWAGTSFGLYLYDETGAAREMQPSRVHLRRFTVNGQETDYVENMSLEHDLNTCRIDFAAVRLRKAAEILYEHRLVNVDSAWSAPSPQRSVHFAALSPGKYTLQIRAIGGDRSSSSEILELRFAVLRPYWLSWWFYAILLAVAASVVAAGIRVKIVRLLENERIRTRIAADLHDDIGAGLTHIGMMSDMMEQQARGLINRRPDVSPEIDALRKSISRTGRIARELVDGMSDVVWSLDPRNDSITQLADRLRVFAYEITDPLEIVMDFRFDASVVRLRARSEITRCLLLVAREALNNLVRHSGATAAAVRIEAVGGKVFFSISDNGRGFDEETLARRSGIMHMRNRVKACGGTIDVISAPGNGTEIRGSVPLEV